MLLDRWQCTVCGYVYDPLWGDPESRVPRGTEFLELPARWMCPDCGAARDHFEPVERTA